MRKRHILIRILSTGALMIMLLLQLHGAEPTEVPSGVFETRAIEVEAIRSIRAGGRYRIILSRGPAEASITSDDNLFYAVQISQADGVLDLQVVPYNQRFPLLELNISLPELPDIDIAGGVELELEGEFEAESWRVQMAGGASLNSDGRVKVSRFTGDFSGGAVFNAVLETEEQIIQKSGGAQVLVATGARPRENQLP